MSQHKHPIAIPSSHIMTSQKSTTTSRPKHSPEYDYLFKLRLVGDAGVGKSSLLLRYIDNIFTEKPITTTFGADFKIENIEIDGALVKLQIWDVGLTRIHSSYYSGAHGHIVVFDVTNQESFVNVQKWLQEIDRDQKSNNMFLIGNKADLVSERSVPFEVAAEFAEGLGLFYIETSAKDGDNVKLAFANVAKYLKEMLEDSKYKDVVPFKTLMDASGSSYSKNPMGHFSRSKNQEKQKLLQEDSSNNQCCTIL